MAPECKRFFNRVALKIADKKGEHYHHVIAFVGTRLRFAMLKLTSVALRGYRGKQVNSEIPLYSLSFNLILSSKYSTIE